MHYRSSFITRLVRQRQNGYHFFKHLSMKINFHSPRPETHSPSQRIYWEAMTKKKRVECPTKNPSISFPQFQPSNFSPTHLNLSSNRSPMLGITQTSPSSPRRSSMQIATQTYTKITLTCYSAKDGPPVESGSRSPPPENVLRNRKNGNSKEEDDEDSVSQSFLISLGCESSAWLWIS